jgi:hypothetical protein
MTSLLYYGTDPEVFAAIKKRGKLYVIPPALFRVMGFPFYDTDRHPVFVKEKDIVIHEDGAAFEFTMEPSDDWKELFEKINLAKLLLKERVLGKFDICDGEVHTVPAIGYEIRRWKKMGDEFAQALIFGCDKDWDAWENNKESSTIDATLHPFRYGAGHVHISGSSFIKEEPILAVECLAVTAGLAFSAFSKVPELEKIRTGLYGRPTKYRFQEYGKLYKGIPFTDFGIEYRTPSNSWTENIEAAENLFKWIKIGITELLEKGLGLEIIPKIKEEVKRAIINCDQVLATQLLGFVEERI